MVAFCPATHMIANLLTKLLDGRMFEHIPDYATQ